MIMDKINVQVYVVHMLVITKVRCVYLYACILIHLLQWYMNPPYRCCDEGCAVCQEGQLR